MGSSSSLFLHRKEVIHPHVPVGIPCYDLTPIISPTFDVRLLCRLPIRLRVLPTLMVWRAVCTRPGNVFTATLLIRDYSRFQLHEVELQTSIRTENGFLRFAPPRRFASLCTVHCSTCVAQVIKGMMIWRHPHLPPIYIGSLLRVPILLLATKDKGCARCWT